MKRAASRLSSANSCTLFHPALVGVSTALRGMTIPFAFIPASSRSMSLSGKYAISSISPENGIAISSGAGAASPSDASGFTASCGATGRTGTDRAEQISRRFPRRSAVRFHVNNMGRGMFFLL